MALYTPDIRPMSERILDPDVQAWTEGRDLSDEAADRIRRVLARWRREQRTQAREGAS